MIKMQSSFRSVLYFISLVAVFTIGANAQCPSLSVTSPSDEIPAGDFMSFSANVVSGETKSAVAISYNWSVSAGSISKGQGTSVIEVDTAGLDGQTITATLELGGLPPACARSASATGSVKRSVLASKIDEFGVANEETEWLRLDNFAIWLQNDPSAIGYIITYRGTKSAVAEAKAVNKRMLKYLVEIRRLDADRFKTIDGGTRPTLWREFWLVPMGAKIPKATPTTSAPKSTTPKKPGIRKKP